MVSLQCDEWRFVMARFESVALTALTIGTLFALFSNVWAAVLPSALCARAPEGGRWTARGRPLTVPARHAWPPKRHPQSRDHRARRPRQDDPARRTPAPDRHLPCQPGSAGARHG